MIFRKKKTNKRIEPGLTSPKSRNASSITVEPADRTAAPAGANNASKKPKRAKQTGSSKGTKRNKAASKASPRKAAPKSGAKRREQKKRGWFSRMVRGSIYWGLIIGIWATIGVTCLVAYYAAKLPQTTTWKIPERPPNVKIVSVDGKLIANRGATGGENMPLDQMSPYIPLAVIAIEDRRFKNHFGFDPIGFTRAMVTNITTGHMVQGGSTLTQQLAKNLFLEPERTLERKVQELVLAVWLETKFTKDEILELYLNRVYFGSGAYGVEAASRRYFNKSARDVNLAEAAILAGLLKAPSKLTPAKNPKAAEERAQVVLGSMRRVGFISDREAARALSMPAKKAKRYWSGSEHYAADLVMGEVSALVGKLNGDVIVDTTIDLDLQKHAGKLIADNIAIYKKKKKVSQGALVSIDGTGAIRALVGGREYADSQYNRASEAKRQPGSAFKPFVYLAALETGRTPESMRQDAPVKIGKWTPSNYSNKYRGPVSLDTALTSSLNTIAAQLTMEVGAKRVVETAKRLGIESDLKRNASISLGTSEVNLLELTTAYAPFANGGYRVTPYVIKRIKTADGKVLYERNSETSPQVVNPREVGMMNYMLQHVIEKGTGKKAAFGDWPVAGKTGTTQNFRDALFVGFTANLVTGIWYGNDDGSSMKKVTGGSLPAQTFSKFMRFAHNGVPVAPLPGNYVPEPPQIIPEPAPQENGSIATSSVGQPAPNRRRSLAEIDHERGGRYQPPASVGEQPARGRPKTIVDLLFGR